MATLWKDPTIVQVVAPTGGVTVNVPAQVGSLFGVPQETKAAGAQVGLMVSGIQNVAKATGALTAGQLVYWDAANANVTATRTAKVAGKVVKAAASGDTTCEVLFEGGGVAGGGGEAAGGYTVGYNATPGTPGVALKIQRVGGTTWAAGRVYINGVLAGAATIYEPTASGAGSDKLAINHQATAAVGVDLHVLADGTLEAANPSGLTEYIETVNGQLIPVAYNASPGGVQMYCDDDGATGAVLIANHASAAAKTVYATRQAHVPL